MYFLLQHWRLLDLGHSWGHSGHSYTSVSAPALVSITSATPTAAIAGSVLEVGFTVALHGLDQAGLPPRRLPLLG